MNRIYKSVWNAHSGTWVAAPESAGRGAAGGRVRAAAVALLLVAGAPLAAHAQLSLGLGAVVSGLNAIGLGSLLGSPATASGSNSIAVGVNVTASGADALALSRNSIAAGSQSVAVGFGSLVSASGTAGLALGTGTSVSGAGSIALGSGSTDGGAANVLSIGTSLATRRIIHVTDGLITAGSSDAVTGGQLYVTNQGQLSLGNALATALGGGASYSLAAGVSVPSYTIRGASVLGVGNAFAAVDASLGLNTSALASLQLQLNTGAIGLVQQSGATAPITVGAATGGTSVDFTGLAGARTLNGVAAGTLAAGSTQAVNGGQLFTTNQQVAVNTSNIATQTGLIDTNTANIATQTGRVDVNTANIATQTGRIDTNTTNISANTSAIASLNTGAVRYDDATKATVTLGGTSGTVIGNVAAGTVASGSMQAVNGGQLFATNQQVSANTSAIASLNTQIASGSTGLVQQSGASQPITVGAATGGAVIDITGTGGARQLAGLADGTIAAGSSQAVTGGQLFTTNQQMAVNTSNIATQTGRIDTNTANIATQTGRIDTNTADIATARTDINANTSAIASLNAGAVRYDDVAKSSLTLGGASGTVIGNVADGAVAAGSMQAVNGGQLFSTNQQVAANTSAISANTTAITNNATDINNLSLQIGSGSVGLVRQSGATMPITVGATTGGLSVDFTGTSGARNLNGVAAGTLVAGSTQAVNGGQLFATNQQVATHTAQIATNTANIAAINAAVTGAGAGATASNNTSVLGVAVASGNDASAVGFGSVAGGTNSTALGNGATSTGNGSVALGNGSNDGGEANVVSIGSVSQKRRVINLADGVADSDAATVGQVRNVDDRVSNLSARAVTYDLNPDLSVNTTRVTFGAAGAPVTLRNVAAGVAATDAVNVGQLQSVASYIGGGMQVGAGGVVAAPSFTINQVDNDGVWSNTSVTSVADAIASLSSSVGYLGQRVHANTGRINTMSTTSSVTTIMENDMYMHVNSDEIDSVASGEDSMAFGPMAQATGDRAVAMGANARALSASSVAIGDAAVAQGGRAVSIGAGNIATGNGAVAIGDPNVATGTGAVAMGLDNTATGDGAIAMGNTSVANGNGAVALGNVARAVGTSSIAIGNAAVVNLAATNGVAMGNGATVNAVNGVAMGNGATVSAANGVAIGAGSGATRAGLSGATEAISGTAVASTQGAVSVGSAGNERQITNVAGGTEDTDAVNLRQLRAAQLTAVEAATQNIDAKLNQLSQGIQRVEQNANAGTAAAMAMAGMPQSAQPGKGMVSAGMATYGGQTALAVGVSMLSDNGKWVSKFQGSAGSRGKVGVSVGVGFQW